MKPHARISSLVIALVALIGSAACATSINRVLADPSHYRNREVKISGLVADSYSLADRGVYRVQDGSGALWVASNHGVPRNCAACRCGAPFAKASTSAPSAPASTCRPASGPA